MGLFRRNKTSSQDINDDDEHDNGSLSKEVTTSGRQSSLSRWLGADGDDNSNTKKEKKKKEKKKKEKKKKKWGKKTSSSSTTSDDDSPLQQHRGGPPPTLQGGPQAFQASQLQSKITEASNERSLQQEELDTSLCTPPPPATISAFEGPARFDWIDVEYSAVTKIQSIFRRYLVLQQLEQEEGMTTSYIRNKRRQRKATPMSLRSSATKVGDDDKEKPYLSGLSCCSVGLAFGGDDDNGDGEYRDFQRRQYEEKAKEQAEREEFLRQSYLEQQGIKDSVQKIDECKSRDELLQS